METLLMPSAVAVAPNRPTLLARLATALRTLRRANPVLAGVGWLNVGLAIAALGLLAFDHRLITGAPAWVKPLKFALSIAAFAWTLGWVLAGLPMRAQRAVRRISWGVALAMAAEQAVIFTQAARGTTSHYNVASLLDAVLFQVMGAFILLNTVVSSWALVLVWRYRVAGAASYVWGVRLGLLVSIVGAVLGGFMIHLNQHTVGGPDGGPGLPGLGWSTVAGDLRIAHFLGLHALQALPLLGWALGRRLPARPALALTVAGAALWAGAVAALLLGALAGKPLLTF